MKTYKTSTPEFKDSVELIEPSRQCDGGRYSEFSEHALKQSVASFPD